MLEVLRDNLLAHIMVDIPDPSIGSQRLRYSAVLSLVVSEQLRNKSTGASPSSHRDVQKEALHPLPRSTLVAALKTRLSSLSA